jgi:prephenate dehydrogenase
MDFSDFKITIVGLGLIGGSLAMAIRDLKPQKLWAIDRDLNTIKAAEEKGIIDKNDEDCKSMLLNSDLVIIALYPEDTAKFMLNNMESFKTGCLITDTCGLKYDMLLKIKDFLRNDIEFIGGHPMSGKESSGFTSADKAIFYNANYIITPTEQNKEETIIQLEELIVALGCKRPIKMSPKDHDKIIAYTSHLPHLTAVALINCFNNAENLDGLIGGSFRDATRVADINSKLWLELIRLNKENVIDILECFINNLSELKTAISNNDQEKLLDDFKKASSRRKEIG